MPICNVTEAKSLARDADGRVTQSISQPGLAAYDVLVEASPVAGPTFNAKTRFIRIVADVPIRYEVLSSGEVAPTGTRLGAEAVEVIPVPPNKSYKLSVRAE